MSPAPELSVGICIPNIEGGVDSITGLLCTGKLLGAVGLDLNTLSVIVGALCKEALSATTFPVPDATPVRPNGASV